ncbi:hypothetical protein BOX15_Mlig006918g1 [Macrostomum lignano]|uniref:Uncharacterized protein n=1 Tax=Macrostomum lignano TaxID=282301 RepID=A0A267GIX5_9PLAT|nr:hypothetical protein BOX15_Mlig006918g1 [Macrostomum lignano]
MSGRRKSLPQQQQPSPTRGPSGLAPFGSSYTAVHGQQQHRQQQQQKQRQQQLHQQLANRAHQLQRRRRALEATRERLLRDMQDRRRALEGTFRWLEDVLTAQRRQRLSEAELLERNCRRLLDKRVGELRVTRDALVGRLGDDSEPSDADLLQLLESATAALGLEDGAGSDAAEAVTDTGGAEESAVAEAVEQLRLCQHRWQADFEAWLKTMPPGPASSATSAQLSVPPSSVKGSTGESEYYSLPASESSSDGPASPRGAATAGTAHQAAHPCASWPTARQHAGDPPTATSARVPPDESEQPRYWSPSAVTASRRGFFDESYQPHQEYHRQKNRPANQPPPPQPTQITTSGCPVSIAFGGPPENLLYIAEEFEDDRPNQVNIYTARGRLVGAFSFNIGQEVNPYRLAWCPQSQRLLVLSYGSRHSTRPFLMDRRGRPAEPFTSATRTLNLASLEPMDMAVADPPGLVFLCCPGQGLLIMDLRGRQIGCHQLGLGAAVAAGWSGSTQQLAVLHSKSQPAFCLSLFGLVEGQTLRLNANCAVDFESIDPPLVIWDGPRVLVVKVTNESGGGCLDGYLAEPGCQLVLETTRLLWQGGSRRNPIHCCLCLHEGQRMLCICDRNHPAVLTCLV